MSRRETPLKISTRSARKSEASERTPTSQKQLTVKRERSTTPRSTTRSVKLAKRKFFTVAEDLKILDYFKKHEDKQNSHQMAQALARVIDHSEESIRDRIKRVLSKLRQVDEKLLADEAKVSSPDEVHAGHFAHFTKINARGRRTITHFTSVPPKVAGSSLTGVEKKAIMREHHKQKRQAGDPHPESKGLPHDRHGPPRAGPGDSHHGRPLQDSRRNGEEGQGGEPGVLQQTPETQTRADV